MSVLKNDPPRCERCGSLYPDDPGAALACCSELEPIDLDDVQEDDELRITFKDGHREKHSIDGSVDEVTPSSEPHRDVTWILVDVPELQGRARVMFGGSVDHVREDRPEVLLGYGAELQRERDVATDGGEIDYPGQGDDDVILDRVVDISRIESGKPCNGSECENGAEFRAEVVDVNGTTRIAKACRSCLNSAKIYPIDNDWVEPKVSTDGGLDEIPRRPSDLESEQEPNLVQACPYCHHSDIYLRGRSDVGRPTPEDDHNYRCKNCKNGFFKPVRRPDRRRTRSGGGSA